MGVTIWLAAGRTPVYDFTQHRGSDMHTFAATGAGFLLAVLWFDLMFDVQLRRHTENPLPPEVLASISAYYLRV
jgi:hypothetical protein